MFDRVTDRSRKVLAFANEHADAFAHGSIHTGHVVLGLATEGDGLAAHVLRYSHVDLQALSDRVAVQSLNPDDANDEMVALDSAAMHTARMLNHNYCGTEHLLLGVCILPSLSGASALTDVDASLSHVGQEILNLIGHLELSYESVFEAYRS
jgi:ATP-dependent Clp protease ATP-binding subunit ClpC